MWSSFQAGQPTTVYRPTNSTGTITNPTLGYDTDAYPWLTSADRALVTGSAAPGTVDTATVQFDTFASLLKSNFSSCTLQIVYSASLGGDVVSTVPAGGGQITTTIVQSGLQIQYQINGSTWVNLDLQNGVIIALPPTAQDGFGANAYSFTWASPDYLLSNTQTKKQLTTTILSSAFAANLSDLKIRFVLQTCTNSTDNTKKSYGSYNVWDIRAIVS